MPIAYGKEAHDLCRKLYCQFGGNADEVEKGMRKEYPSWGKQNLYDRDDRHGWITKLNLEKSLEIDQKTKIHSVENDDERSYRVLVELGQMYEQKALDGDDKAVNVLLKINDQKIEFRSKLDLSSSSFESFAESFENIVKWAKEIDTELAKLFYKHSDKFIKRAEMNYGKNAEQTSD